MPIHRRCRVHLLGARCELEFDHLDPKSANPWPKHSFVLEMDDDGKIWPAGFYIESLTQHPSERVKRHD